MPVSIKEILGPIHCRHEWVGNDVQICYCINLNPFIAWEALVRSSVQPPTAKNYMKAMLAGPGYVLRHDLHAIHVVSVESGECFKHEVTLVELFPISFDPFGESQEVIVDDKQGIDFPRSLDCELPTATADGKGCILESWVSGTYRLCKASFAGSPVTSDDLDEGDQAILVSSSTESRTGQGRIGGDETDFSDSFSISQIEGDEDSADYSYEAYVEHCHRIAVPHDTHVPAEPRGGGPAVPGGSDPGGPSTPGGGGGNPTTPRDRQNQLCAPMSTLSSIVVPNSLDLFFRMRAAQKMDAYPATDDSHREAQ